MPLDDKTIKLNQVATWHPKLYRQVLEYYRLQIRHQPSKMNYFIDKMTSISYIYTYAKLSGATKRATKKCTKLNKSSYINSTSYRLAVSINQLINQFELSFAYLPKPVHDELMHLIILKDLDMDMGDNNLRHAIYMDLQIVAQTYKLTMRKFMPLATKLEHHLLRKLTKYYELQINNSQLKTETQHVINELKKVN